MQHPYAQPQAIPNPGDLGFDFSTATGNFSLPADCPSSSSSPSYEEHEVEGRVGVVCCGEKEDIAEPW